MAKHPPKTVTLNHDQYHAEYIGRIWDGRQFFLTTPFVPASGKEAGREFIALYVFDKVGNLQSATIDDLGARAKLDHEARIVRRDELIASLGKLKFQGIKIAPFRIEMFGVEFGLIPQPPEEPGEDWKAIVEPGNYMCFWPPWTTGDYDT